MKKILLASTALVLSAGIANAQAVTIGGNGRFGIISQQVRAVAGTGTAAQITAINTQITAQTAAVATAVAAATQALAAYNASPTAANAAAVAAANSAVAAAQATLATLAATRTTLVGTPGSTTTSLENRLRLQFNVAVQADNGLSFGGFIRIQSGSNGTAFSSVFSGSRVWVEASGLRLTFGNQDGAIQSRLVGAQTVGYTGGTFAGSSAGMYIFPQGQTSNGAGPNQRVGIQYQNAGAFVHLSHDRASVTSPSGTEIAIGGTFDAFSVMAGYANRRATAGVYGANSSIATVAASYNGGSWGASVIVARLSGLGTNFTVGGGVDLGGGRLNGYVGRYIDGVAATSDTTYGIGYSYNLGGGARMAAGFERTNGLNRAEVGVAFNF